MSAHHFANLSFCQQIILSTHLFVNSAFHQLIILLTNHFVNLSFCPPTIQSNCHYVNLHKTIFMRDKKLKNRGCFKRWWFGWMTLFYYAFVFLSAKWRIDEMTHWRNGVLMKWRVDKMARWQKWRIGEMARRRNDSSHDIHPSPSFFTLKSLDGWLTSFKPGLNVDLFLDQFLPPPFIRHETLHL